MSESRSMSIWRLIAVPFVITLAITVLRLVGELAHWGMPFFGAAAGGEGAIVGISWLPIIFGPYFAIKLWRFGYVWPSAGRAVAWLLVGIALMVAGGYLVSKSLSHPSGMVVLYFEILLLAAILAAFGWPAFGRTLLAYAFAARLPVVVVYYLAMHGNGGAGWGTHYDATTPGFPHLPLAQKFLYLGLLPQTTLWIAWTVIGGGIFGLIAVAIMRPWRSVTSVAAS